MEKAFCFCDGVMILSPNVALSICVHLRRVRALWVNSAKKYGILPHSAETSDRSNYVLIYFFA